MTGAKRVIVAKNRQLQCLLSGKRLAYRHDTQAHAIETQQRKNVKKRKENPTLKKTENEPCNKQC
jgi:hypothetical protein